MRILHFSDLHIGVETYGRTDPLTGLSTRLSDFLKTFDEIVSYAIDENVDLVLFSGDAYKSRDPNQTHQREFARRIARLSSEGIPVFLLTGNHDVPHITSRATTIDIFRTLKIANVYTAESLKTFLVETKDGPLQIVALPWIRRGSFLAREEILGMPLELVNEEIQKRLSEILLAEAVRLDASIPAILAGHISLSDAKTSSEQYMMLGRDHILLKSALALPQFDYVALGHIHRHQVLSDNPMIVYAGSPVRTDFSEEADVKGFCLVELDPSKPCGSRLSRFEFKEVETRRFLTITVAIDQAANDPTSAVVEAVQAREISGAVVRVIIKLTGERAVRFNYSAIRKSLEKAYYIASISTETVQDRKIRLGENYSKSLKPIDALNIYLKSRDVAPDRIEELMRFAREIVDDIPQ